MQLRAFPINTGGQIALDQIVGRDVLCARVLGRLDRQSVILTGERRTGKTSLSLLVAARAAEAGWTVVRQSAEGFESLDDLAAALISRLDERGGALQRAARDLASRTTLKPGPVEIDLAPRSESFEEVVASAVAAADGRLLLVLDEVPLFAKELDNADPDRRPGTAALHVLRRLRESHPGMRMLCLGSIGFHHVTRDASGVINDTASVHLDPLDHASAAYLAGCLMLGAGLMPSDPGAAAAIARAAECVPYYVHKVVESLDDRPDRTVRTEDAQATVQAALTAPDDPWDLRHYRDRIPTYYDAQAPLARAILDALVVGPADLDGIVARVSTTDAGLDAGRDTVRDVVDLLASDHYLAREQDDRRFSFELVRRAWLALRS